MTLDYSKLPELWQWVLLIGAVLTALLVITGVIRVGWKALIVLVKLAGAAPALMDLPQFMITTAHTLADQDQKIEEIHHEVQFNNGSSVKDAVTRMETKQKSVLAAQRRIEKGVAGLYDRVDATEKAATQDRADIAAARQELEDTRPTRTIKPKEKS